MKKETCIINGIEKRFTEKRKAAAAALFQAYQRENRTDLNQVYGRCSYAKQRAMQACRNDAAGPVKILSANTFIFTVVYVSADRKYIVHDTGRTESRYPLSWITTE